MFFSAAATPWVVVVVSGSKVGVRDPGLERGVDVCVFGVVRVGILFAWSGGSGGGGKDQLFF